MSGGRANATKRGLEYYTENPWNGEGDHHEDWLEVLALEAITLGGQPLRDWVRGEGWDIDEGNVDFNGEKIYNYLAAHDYKTAQKAWKDNYFWTVAGGNLLLECGSWRARALLYV